MSHPGSIIGADEVRLDEEELLDSELLENEEKELLEEEDGKQAGSGMQKRRPSLFMNLQGPSPKHTSALQTPSLDSAAHLWH